MASVINKPEMIKLREEAGAIIETQKNDKTRRVVFNYLHDNHHKGIVGDQTKMVFEEKTRAAPTNYLNYQCPN
jgi:microcystin degradation protein MlrC